MRQAGVKLVALFSPEHGFAGVEDREGIGDAVDPATGLKVFSLYGATQRPTPEMLRGLDALVFDIQDVGARCYTYETTMAYAMESAAKAGIEYYVLDRPNPITGTHVEGPLLDAANKSFIGYWPGLPMRHGMTMGELAQFYNGENKIGAKLTVVSMTGLAARRLVRFHESTLGEPVAQHAQPQGRYALSWCVSPGIFEELFRRPWNRFALRADRRGFHRGP